MYIHGYTNKSMIVYCWVLFWLPRHQANTSKTQDKPYLALPQINLSEPVNTKYLNNICTRLARRRRRWADVVKMLYKCFVFTGNLTGKSRLTTVIFRK